MLLVILRILSFQCEDTHISPHIQKDGACIGPKRGPVQAKTAENACKGPKDGPVRTLRNDTTALALRKH